MSGQTAIVGAFFNDDNGESSGAAYIFQRDQGGPDNWGEVTKLTASDAATGHKFGNCVSIDGDTAIVGAYTHDGAGTMSGAAYIFQRHWGGPNNWGEVAKLTASDAAANDWFGLRVSLAGSTAIVGAPRNDDNGSTSGSVYVYYLHGDIPTVSAWGLAVMALLVMSAGTVVLTRRRVSRVAG